MVSLWADVLESFNWSIVTPIDSKSWICMLLLDHPFKNTKEIIWTNIVSAVLWKIWDKRNAWIFKDKAKSIEEVLHSVALNAFYWCKSIPALQSHSFSFLITNWKHLFPITQDPFVFYQ